MYFEGTYIEAQGTTDPFDLDFREESRLQAKAVRDTGYRGGSFQLARQRASAWEDCTFE